MSQAAHADAFHRTLPSGHPTGRSSAARHRLTALALVALIACSAWASAQTPSALDRVTVTVDGAIPTIIPEVGIVQGIFREQGLEVAKVFAPKSGEAIQLALSGRSHFGFATAAPLLESAARGESVVVIGLLSHGFSGKLVASNANAHLTSLADFRGKRIAVQKGTGVTTIFLLALENAGLKESDFQIQDVRVFDMPAAMRGGNFDAVLGWEPGMSRIVDDGHGKEIISNKRFEQLTGTTYPFLLFTSRNLVDTQPGLVQRFVTAWAKSQVFTRTDRPAALKVIRNYLGKEVAGVGDGLLEKLTYIYEYDRAALVEADFADIRIMSEFMFRQGGIKSRPDMKVFVNNDFARQAEALMRRR